MAGIEPTTSAAIEEPTTGGFTNSSFPCVIHHAHSNTRGRPAFHNSPTSVNNSATGSFRQEVGSTIRARSEKIDVNLPSQQSATRTTEPVATSNQGRGPRDVGGLIVCVSTKHMNQNFSRNQPLCVQAQHCWISVCVCVYINMFRQLFYRESPILWGHS